MCPATDYSTTNGALEVTQLFLCCRTWLHGSALRRASSASAILAQHSHKASKRRSSSPSSVRTSEGLRSFSPLRTLHLQLLASAHCRRSQKIIKRAVYASASLAPLVGEHTFEGPTPTWLFSKLKPVPPTATRGRPTAPQSRTAERSRAPPANLPGIPIPHRASRACRQAEAGPDAAWLIVLAATGSQRLYRG
jgi:hypothetical protein